MAVLANLQAWVLCLVWLLGIAHVDSRENRTERKQTGSQAGFPPGLHDVRVWQGSLQRRYLLYVPKGYRISAPIPLWILAHGTADSPEIILKMSGVTRLAERYTFAFVALEAVQGAFNVGLDARPENSEGPDDVGYTMTVLAEVVRRLHIDMQRIRCAGFSRGGRFCSRLASELSSFITGIAVVSGIRFPRPNNATRPMPVLAFHGTDDPVNPYKGMGNDYWGSSVDDAVQRWADFNGCKRHVWEKTSVQVLRSVHTGCASGADVVLIRIKEGGHTWPGSWYDFGSLGYVTHEIQAQDEIYKFFTSHPMEMRCHTAVRGSPCYDAVQWAMRSGIAEHPSWYPGLDASSPPESFQALLHRRIAADCPPPCPQQTAAAGTAVGTTTSTVTFTVPARTTLPAATPTSTSSEPRVFEWIGESELEHADAALGRRWGPPPALAAGLAAAGLAAAAAVPLCRSVARRWGSSSGLYAILHES